MELQTIKQRFGIIGNSPLLNRAINIAAQVAPTDLSVLIAGESGTGKEVFPDRKRSIPTNYSPNEYPQARAFYCGKLWGHP